MLRLLSLLICVYNFNRNRSKRLYRLRGSRRFASESLHLQCFELISRIFYQVCSVSVTSVVTELPSFRIPGVDSGRIFVKFRI